MTPSMEGTGLNDADQMQVRMFVKDSIHCYAASRRAMRAQAQRRSYVASRGAGDRVGVDILNCLAGSAGSTGSHRRCRCFATPIF